MPLVKSMYIIVVMVFLHSYTSQIRIGNAYEPSLVSNCQLSIVNKEKLSAQNIQ